MRVFIYRRTHVGDPCQCGIFGVHDCMKSCRSLPYDAVIGIGGLSQLAKSEGIARRLTWVGIRPHKHLSRDRHRGPNVTFDRFCLMDTTGPLLDECAPLLAKHMFQRERIPHWSWLASRPPEIQQEVDALLQRYRRCRPSKHRKCQCQRATLRSSC